MIGPVCYEEILKTKKLNPELTMVYKLFNYLDKAGITVNDLDYYDPILVRFRSELKQLRKIVSSGQTRYVEEPLLAKKIKKLYLAGYTTDMTAEKLKCDAKTVRRWIRQHKLVPNRKYKLYVQQGKHRTYFSSKLDIIKFFNFKTSLINHLGLKEERTMEVEGVNVHFIGEPVILQDIAKGDFYVRDGDRRIKER